MLIWFLFDSDQLSAIQYETLENPKTVIFAASGWWNQTVETVENVFVNGVEGAL